MKRIVAAMGVGLAVVACHNGSLQFDLTPAPAMPDVSPTRPSTPEVGVVWMISDAIAKLQLSKEQNTQLLTVVHNLEDAHAHVQELKKRLSLDIASSVEAGAVDEKGLTADASSLGHARADIAPVDAKALEDLHRILSPDQRKQFAAGLDALADNLRLDDISRRYANWRSDLEISIDQNEKIEPKLDADGAVSASAHAEQAAWRKRLHATAAAFASDPYTAAAYSDPDVVGTTVERVRRLVAFLDVVVPYLTPEQRKTAGANLRAEVGVSRE